MNQSCAANLPLPTRRGGVSVLLLAALLAAPACASRRCPAAQAPGTSKAGVSIPERTGEAAAGGRRAAPGRDGSEAHAVPYALYEGTRGRPLDLEGFLRLTEGSQLIAFGELHGDAVGSAMELRLLEALVAQEQPVALALEFFERDMQGDLDEYLSGRTTEADFLRATRRDDTYAHTHRPLIELCKQRGIPVIAANAPRRLVSAYRTSELSYADYRASLGERERAYLPAQTTVLEDRHRDRFMQLMGPERGAKLFKSMSLWDDAMAESITRFQEAHSTHRVLLVVGSFHVTERLGTIAKYLSRAPQARAGVLLMSYSQNGSLAFEAGDMGAGDVILKVRSAAPRRPPG